MRLITLLAIISASSAVSAEEGGGCGSLKRSIAQATPLSMVIQKGRSLNLSKDEYESTASFAERAKAAGSTLDSNPTILWDQAGLTTYDADAGRVIVGRYAMDSHCLLFKSSLSPTVSAVHIGPLPKYDFQKQDNPYCLTKDVSSASRGRYAASNAFGATTTVNSIRTFTEGIYLGTGILGYDYFPTTDYSSVNSSPWLSAEATAGEARSLAKNAALLISIELRPPYYAKASHYISPTISAPRSIETQIHMVVGLPLCIALIDKATGKIFAERPFIFGPRYGS